MVLSTRPKAWVREVGWGIPMYEVWDTLDFPLQEWRLLTTSWTELNVSLDATARPATSPHLRRVLHLDWVGIASGTLQCWKVMTKNT